MRKCLVVNEKDHLDPIQAELRVATLRLAEAKFLAGLHLMPWTGVGILSELCPF